MSTVLVLRTVDKDRKAYGGFVWPESGPVEAPDWKPEPTCGGGLHGYLRGEGNAESIRWEADALWQVVEVDEETIVDLGGKVKFPRGSVLYTGTREEATRRLVEAYPGRAVIAGTASAGDRGTASAGYGGTASAGDRGTASAGYGGTASAGESGTASAGHGGTASAGYGGTASAGHGGTASAGYGGTASAGYGGTASAGHGGTASAGESGTASAGYGGTASAGESGTASAGHGGTASAGHGGTASAGYGGTASAGESGILQIRWFDCVSNRYRIATAYVGEDGIEAGKKYRLDDEHRFVLAEGAP